MAEIVAGRPWSEVAGLVYRGNDGRLVHNPPRDNVPLDNEYDACSGTCGGTTTI